MSLNIKPIAGTENRVVVAAAPAETVTASGIYIPETAQEKPQKVQRQRAVPKGIVDFRALY